MGAMMDPFHMSVKPVATKVPSRNWGKDVCVVYGVDIGSRTNRKPIDAHVGACECRVQFGFVSHKLVVKCNIIVKCLGGSIRHEHQMVHITWPQTVRHEHITQHPGDWQQRQGARLRRIIATPPRTRRARVVGSGITSSESE